MLEHINYPISALCVSGPLQEVKNKRKFFALKVDTVPYKRWSLTKGSKYSNLTWKLLVFWKTDR